MAANWVDQQGGLPPLIKRIARHIREKNPGWDQSRAIATAVNAVRRMATSGDTNFPGVQRVSPKARAEAARALAQWERMKAAAKARRSADLSRDQRRVIDLVASGAQPVLTAGGWVVPIDLAINYRRPAGWKENQHPRAADGKFTTGPGAGGRIDYTRRAPKKRATAGGSWQARISPGPAARPDWRSQVGPGPAARNGDWRDGITGGARSGGLAPGGDGRSWEDHQRAAGTPGGRGAGEAPADSTPGSATAGAERVSIGEVHDDVEFSVRQNGAIRHYTSDAYETINRSLRGSRDISDADQATIDDIDAAFEAVPPLGRPIVLERGIRGDGPFPASPPPMTPGAEFRDNAYVSTATELHERFRGDTVIEVRVPAGQRVIDINATAGSFYPEEAEVLLPRGARFRVVSDGPGDGGVGRRITVEVVPDGA